ncbi:MAG TPA: hypothetical protein VE843_06060 [Ktedonobacteraceae bacterium]|nr:hypothetical protein [Ktedonobacteraceae bacterium]
MPSGVKAAQSARQLLEKPDLAQPVREGRNQYIEQLKKYAEAKLD